MKKLPYIFIGILLLMALGDGWLNQPLPIFIQNGNQTMYPFFQENDTFSLEKKPFYKVEWREILLPQKINSPCAYSPKQSESPSFQSPIGTQYFQDTKGKQQVLTWQYRHWLGTDETGRDVLSILIHGANIVFKLSGFSILLLLVIGVALGIFAAYFQDNQLKLSVGEMAAIVLGAFLSFFYGFYINPYFQRETLEFNTLSDLMIILSLLFFLILGTWLCYFIAHKLFPRAKKYPFPLDTLIIKIIETKNTIPSLLWILVFAVYLKGFYALVLMVTFVGWTGVAQIARLETLKVKNELYIEAAQSAGLPTWRIFVFHILSNISTPLFSIMLLSISGIILLETSLSFLGIGIASGESTWGSILEQARGNLDKWWLIFFPTFMITATIISLYQIRQQFLKKNSQ